MVAITSQSMTDEILRQQRLSQRITDDQAAVSTGKRVRMPSQDPQAWVQISEIGQAQAQNAAWIDTISYGQARAQKAEANLQEVNSLFSRARELMVNAATSTLDAAGLSGCPGVRRHHFDQGSRIARPGARRCRHPPEHRDGHHRGRRPPHA